MQIKMFAEENNQCNSPSPEQDTTKQNEWLQQLDEKVILPFFPIAPDRKNTESFKNMIPMYGILATNLMSRSVAPQICVDPSSASKNMIDLCSGVLFSLNFSKEMI